MENLPMTPLGYYLALLAQQDRLDDGMRRAALFAAVDAAPIEPTVPAWRRTVGGGARRLSGAFASVARSIDPSADMESNRHGRAFAG
jgi:hypothetical protein